MDFDEAHKNKIGQQLALRLAKALEDQEIGLIEAPMVSRFILDNIDKVKTHVELVDFLTRLTEEWPLFYDILVFEKGEEDELGEQEKIEEIKKLIQEDKINNAVNNNDNLIKN